VEFVHEMLDEVHEKFIDYVLARRGAKLKAGKPASPASWSAWLRSWFLAAPKADVFNGDFWVGNRAIRLGLADGVGEVRSTMRGRYGPRVRIVQMMPQGWLEQVLGAQMRATVAAVVSAVTAPDAALKMRAEM